MRASLPAFVAAILLVTPASVAAQTLPDRVRAAGATVAEWDQVRAEVRRAAAEKHISEKALAAVCVKMGIALAKHGQLDIGQLISLLDAKADQINALYKRFSLAAKENSPTVARLLMQARKAIDAGELDKADHILQKAGIAADVALDGAQRRRAEIKATQAQVKELQADYLGAAADYASASGSVPAGDKPARWRYLTSQAGALSMRGELFNEPLPLQEAIIIYRDSALPIVPKGEAPDKWATTWYDIGNSQRLLGQRGSSEALFEAVASYKHALEVRTPDGAPLEWAKAQIGLANTLETLGERGDEEALRTSLTTFRRNP